MATQAQINANRSNAQHCTGPKTDEGRAVSSANARRHGLTSTRVLFPGEDPVEWQRCRDGIFQEFQPESEFEVMMTNLVADHYWRLLRAERVEEELMASAYAAGAPPSIELCNKLARYVGTINGHYLRTLAALRKVQSERRKIEEEEISLQASKTVAARRDLNLQIQNLSEQMRSASIGFVSQTPQEPVQDQSAPASGTNPPPQSV